MIPLALPVVEFTDATFAYDGTVVLHDIDLRVDPGELVGLLGPSGAGKTTLLRALLGQVRARRGRVGPSSLRRAHPSPR